MSQGLSGEPPTAGSAAGTASAIAVPAAPPSTTGGKRPSYGSDERPLRGYAEASTRLRLATLGVGLAVATGLASAITTFIAYGEGRAVIDALPAAGSAKVDDVPAGVTDAQINAVNEAWNRQEAWLAPWGLAILLAGFFVLVWQIRANRNLPELGFRESRYGPISGTLCWFIPLWQLVGPKSAFNELWQSGLDEGEEPAAEPPSPPVWLMLWWGSWLVAIYGSRIAFAATDGGTLGEQVDGWLWGGIFQALLVVAGLLMIRIMWRITDRQRRMAGHRGLREA